MPYIPKRILADARDGRARITEPLTLLILIPRYRVSDLECHVFSKDYAVILATKIMPAILSIRETFQLFGR